VKRAILTLFAIVVFSLYIVSNRILEGRPAATLGTPLDARIPFLPPAEFVYVSVFLFLFLPVVQVRDLCVFRRAAIAFSVSNLLAIAIFWAFPVRMVRPEGFPLETFPAWGVALNYWLDPPYNGFPSLHVSNAVFAGFLALRLDRPVGGVALGLAGAISVSTLLVKQHYLADVLAGALTGWLAYRAIVAPAIPREARREELVFPRRYLLLLPAIYAAAVIGLYVLGYRSGWLRFPWPLREEGAF
jgi:membrane-associated phospholipid phosphatase